MAKAKPQRNTRSDAASDADELLVVTEPRCHVCTHEARRRIELETLARSRPLARIAASYTLSRSSLQRHMARHLDPHAVVAHVTARTSEGSTLVDRLAGFADMVEEHIADDEGNLDTRAGKLYADTLGRLLQRLDSDSVSVSGDGGALVLTEHVDEFVEALAAGAHEFGPEVVEWVEGLAVAFRTDPEAGQQ